MKIFSYELVLLPVTIVNRSLSPLMVVAFLFLINFYSAPSKGSFKFYNPPIPVSVLMPSFHLSLLWVLIPPSFFYYADLKAQKIIKESLND